MMGCCTWQVQWQCPLTAVSCEPEVTVFHNFLSAAECEHLIKTVRAGRGGGALQVVDFIHGYNIF